MKPSDLKRINKQRLVELINDKLQLTDKMTAKDVSLSIKDGALYVNHKFMYRFIQINFDSISALKDIFGTSKIDVDTKHICGCETCDYGSAYITKLIIRDAKFPVDIDANLF